MGDMAGESKESKERREASAANTEATQREAYEYWGYLFQPDKCGTELLDRLLRGIAEVISTTFEPGDSPDLTPAQLAAWYRSVGGDNDMLFTDTLPSSIAFIYRSLGAYHSLQPASNDDGYSAPTTPALKKQGFVTWQTIQLLLGPQEHVAFIQKSLEQFDVIDPQTKTAFPKILPSKCFPSKPDEAMEEWYEGVAARLKNEAEEEARRPHMDAQPGLRTSTDTSGDGSSADEKQGAFKYFEDPMYRKARPRPTFMRHVSKEQVRDERGRVITSRVRHMLNPFSRRKSLPPGRYEDDDYSDEDATPVATHPPVAPRHAPHKRPYPPRRESSVSSTDSDSDDEPPSRRRTPVHVDRRPVSRATSPREYFPAYPEVPHYPPQHLATERADKRHSSAPAHPVYGPTKAPLFATHIAQLEARNHYARPTLAPRSSYRPAQPNVRYGMQSTPVSPPRDEPAYAPHHSPYRERGGDVYDHSAHAQRRRSTEDSPYARERNRGGDSGRTRSHDRVKDERRERERYDRSREHSRDRRHERDRERDGERRHGSHRYVSGGVQDGVSGRQYPAV